MKRLWFACGGPDDAKEVKAVGEAAARVLGTELAEEGEQAGRLLLGCPHSGRVAIESPADVVEHFGVERGHDAAEGEEIARGVDAVGSVGGFGEFAGDDV